MNELLSIDLSQISFGALFVWLLFDTNKKNENRELKYQEIINNLSENISNIDLGGFILSTIKVPLGPLWPSLVP